MKITFSSDKQLYAGAGSAKICFPPEMFPTEGFNAIHDDPHLRILILDGDIKLALIACEMVVVAKPFVADIKKIVSQITGTAEDNIWVHGTHAISTPHAPGPKPIGPPHLRKQPTEEEKIKRALFTDALNAAASEAANKAAASLVPAKMGYGKGECHVNISTRELDLERGMMTDIDGLNITDNDLNIIKFEDNDRKLIALLLNYALMSNAIDNSEMDKGTRQVSSDVPGKACSLLEEKYGAPVLYFMSAAADQKPREQAMYFVRNESGERETVDKGVAYGLELVDKYGQKLADCACGIADSIECSDDHPMIASLSSSFVVNNKPRPMGGPGGPGGGKGLKDGKGPEGPTPDPGESELAVLAARIGSIGLVATNPELCCATGIELKEKSPFETTLLISFTDGPKGIMADKASFAKDCPEQKASFAVEGSAEKFVDTAVKLLNIL